MDDHRIPGHVTAAARLGAAKDLKQVVIVVAGNATRELYLADDCGNQPLENRDWKWADSWRSAEAKQRRPAHYKAYRQRRDDPYDRGPDPHAPKQRKTERVFRVVAHLGSMPEGVRSTMLMQAENNGVPVWNWPGERLPYRVEGLEGE